MNELEEKQMDMYAERIRRSKSLLQLCVYLNRLRGLSLASGVTEAEMVDLCSLPNFGDEPASTEGIYSWDGDGRVLIYDPDARRDGGGHGEWTVRRRRGV